MIKLILISGLLLVAATSISVQQNDFPKLTGPYLWGEAIDLTRHGIKPDSKGAYISPDGKYLFFNRGGDIYWVSTKIIEDLRPKKSAASLRPA